MRYLSLLLFLSISSFSQEIPPVQSFKPSQYKAENQNWAIAQDNRNYIYVANNKGLLEYNGDDWNLFETPNESIIRSILHHDNVLYTGFYNDFGYWERDNFGKLNFQSLKDRFNIQMLEDEQIWEIYELDGWILFKSLQRIYLINQSNNVFKIIEGQNNITKLSKVNDTFYFQDYGIGVFKIENGKPVLFSSDEFVANNKIVEFFEREANLHIVTQGKGLFVLSKSGLREADRDLNKSLSKFSIYSAKKLSNNSLAIGTISNGLVYVTQDFEITYNINQKNGLSNNTILAVYQDKDQNLWLGLDKGIGLVNINSPFRFYNDSAGSLGTVYASVKYNGNIYLGTNQGLFYKKENTNQEYKILNNTLGQVWSLSIIDNRLFCGHDKGTLLIDKRNNANLISNILGTWMVKQIDSNTLIQGNYDGLHIIKRNSKSWYYSHKLENYNTSSKQFELIDDKTLIVNHEYKGVYKLRLSEDLNSVEDYQRIDNVNKGIHSSITKYDGKVLYASRNGVFIYNEQIKKFERDSIYSFLIPENNFESGKLVVDEGQNKLWSFTSQGLKYLTKGSLGNTYKINEIPIVGSLIKSASGYENIMLLDKERYLLGTSDGYIVLDLGKNIDPAPFEVKISSVGKYLKDRKVEDLELTNPAKLTPDYNNLIFTCNLANYTETSIKKYSYKLEGYNTVWNDLQNSNKIVFENLPPGSYTLNLVGYLNTKKSENVAEYKFTIAKPWYRSDLFYALYVFLLILLIFTIHLFTRKYYQSQRKKILEQTQKELEMKELENSRQIIKLNNEKLRNDIEGKNRELATSTMSIIKKNEFLNEIKKELSKGGEKSISKVIRIIDKDLNNTDDWKMFQEAFNNADKKFLRKIKTKHPGLTPNDLRLCAYLRLNLSSKEIAPLLNISPRSVEVKRYRLRKKMNLDHDINLTNYIIEL